MGTTHTSKLVASLKDRMKGTNAGPTSPGFGLSWANVGEQWFPQIVRKGVILERWGHKIYWVSQVSAYRRLLDSHGLHAMAFDQAHATVFLAYDVIAAEQGNTLACTSCASARLDPLFGGFAHNAPLPSKDAFLGALEQRMREMVCEGVRREPGTA